MLIDGETEKEREGREGRKSIHPSNPYMRVPEWNSLCWLVESERRKERRKVALSEREKQELPRSTKHPF
jgi:hypothetical protein